MLSAAFGRDDGLLLYSTKKKRHEEKVQGVSRGLDKKQQIFNQMFGATSVSKISLHSHVTLYDFICIIYTFFCIIMLSLKKHLVLCARTVA